MPSSVSTFANSNDALRCLSENIQSQRLLYKLCLVNRRFNTEFSTSLYRHVHIRNNKELKGLLGSPHPTHTRRLTIEEEVQHWSSPREVNELFRQVLVKTPNLEALTWSGIALAAQTIKLLHQSCNKIKSIHVEYPAEIEGRLLGLGIADEEDQDDEGSQEARTLFRNQDFSVFTDLEELTLNNIYGDLPRWRRALVKILKSSPHLRKLDLSLSTETIARAYHHGNFEAYDDFFGRLCDEYEGSGASPLQLLSLACGSAIYPKNATSLQKLTDLSHLEEVHIQNESVQGEMVYIYMYDEDGSCDMVFDTFLSPICRNLRRFTAYQLQEDVFEALCNNENGSWTRQLAISFECPDEGDFEMAQILMENDDYPNLPMQLRMIDLDLKGNNEGETEEILDNLVSSNSETLEGLAVRLPQGQDQEISNLELVQDTTQKMPKLTQITINLHTSIHGRNDTAVQQHKAAAENLANAAPQLQFINIGWSFWHIWRTLDAEGKISVVLESMDEWEREDVELFQHTIFKAS